MERVTHPRKFALIGGFLMLATGVLAFIPGFFNYTNGLDLPALRVETSYGAFLGMVAMNIFNKVALIVLGLLGISAANNDQRVATRDIDNEVHVNVSAEMGGEFDSIRYSRFIFFVTGALAILGLFPQTNTLFGYWPLFGANVALYAIASVFGGYFGYSLHSRRQMEHHHHTPHLRGV